MSEKNLETVRRAYELNAQPGGWALIAEVSVPDAVMDFSLLYPDGPVLRGVDELRRFSEQTPWAGQLAFEVEELIRVDADRVLALVVVQATGEASGVRIENHVAHVHTLRDGKIAHWVAYGNRSEALEAVGLRA
jgi:ketosteroid isomerase-like protein